MSISGSHHQLTVGKASLTGSILASMVIGPACGGTSGSEPTNETERAVEPLFQLPIRDSIAQSNPPIVREGGAGHQRDALLLHQLLAEALTGNGIALL